ncbi:ricin-type beta-trefoil lectin domain protein [Streptacidiphilus cavernicola]|uniref:Ricin-type beta-trefoil lectin domain protein n=1 Tax=Streptacidiphilus cavernicola TaxID=3342716 RepID=A0ABV6VW55_9ACTN
MTWARRKRALVASALPVAAVAMAITGAGQSQAASSFPAHYAAPYLQISSGTAGDMAADMNATGLKNYTLAFLIPKSGCTQQWEDGGDSVGAFSSQINSLKSAGGNVIVSFGGAEGGEVAQTCTSVSSLTAAYANVVNTYGITRLDFDIEGGTLGDTASNTRRNQALAALQAQNPSVEVDYTLAVDPTGLPSQELGVLQSAKSAGVNVSVVNIMTMDFGDGQNAFNDAESAAKATASQLANLYGISTSAAYGRLGLTPIAGQNDDNENFTQANATALESFAASNGVAELSFWEVDGYDKGTGYAYSRIFNQITGGGTTPPPPPTGTGQITGYGGKCVDVAAANSANGTAVQLYTCNGTNAQQWTVASNGTLQALGKCMDVTSAGTANGTKVQLYDCNGTAAQTWTHQSNGELVNSGSGKCLDATGPSSADGTRLQIWSCTDAANQQWTLPS